MKPVTILLSLAIAFSATPTQARMNDKVHDDNATLALIATFVGGSYDNSAQIAAQVAADIPLKNRSMPIHQSITPAEIDAFDGLKYFYRLSSDKTPETIFNAGFYQFDNDPESGVIVMKMYIFNDMTQFTTAPVSLERLKAVTPDDVHTTKGCEFYLSINDDVSSIEGVMKENACFPISRVSGVKMQHKDTLVIKRGEFWNDPAFYVLDGNVLMKNMSGNFQKQVRYTE
jgi:hypothetical protein